MKSRQSNFVITTTSSDVSETAVQYAETASPGHTYVYTCLLTNKRPFSTRRHRNKVIPWLAQQKPAKSAQVLVHNSMAALTGLLGDYGSDDESDNNEAGTPIFTHIKARPFELASVCDHFAQMLSPDAGTQEVEMAEAGEAASRSASVMLSTVDGAPQISTEELLTEINVASLPQQPAEFDLPSEIAEPPDQVCSAAVQVRCLQLCTLLMQLAPASQIQLNELAAGQHSQAARDTEQG